MYAPYPPIDAVPAEEIAFNLDALLNEALDETFPASDPVSSLCFD
jgi:hypothetical protein